MHHQTLGDVVASHWSDVSTFAYVLVLLAVVRICFRD
jgi:hypothetical protein